MQLTTTALELGRADGVAMVKNLFLASLWRKVNQGGEKWAIIEPSEIDNWVDWHVDPEGIISKEGAGAAGVGKLKKIILAFQNELAQQCGSAVEFGAAAMILACIYDPKKNEMGPIHVQNGKEDFYLGTNIDGIDLLKAASNKSPELELLDKSELQSGLLAVVGNCGIEYVPIDDKKTLYAVKITQPIFPLLIMRWAGRKLFVFK